MGNYDFKRDLAVAKKTEKEVIDLMEKYFTGAKLLSVNKTSDFDFEMIFEGKASNGVVPMETKKVEVKEDFMCNMTGNMVVEYECRGKPSGISTTKADWYVYKFHEGNGLSTYYVAKTSAIKKAIEREMYKKEAVGGDKDSKTKMYIFDLNYYKDTIAFCSLDSNWFSQRLVQIKKEKENKNSWTAKPF